MNEPISHLNERDPEDLKGKVKKDLKELKVTTYMNKVHLPFRLLDHRNSKVKHA